MLQPATAPRVVRAIFGLFGAGSGSELGSIGAASSTITVFRRHDGPFSAVPEAELNGNRQPEVDRDDGTERGHSRGDICPGALHGCGNRFVVVKRGRSFRLPAAALVLARVAV